MNAAAGLVEVRVPDMGNFKDVAIIDVLVKPGESIERESPLVTLETEKATMDVPSTVGGVVEKIHIAKGGTVSAGDLIVTVRSDQAEGGTGAKDGRTSASDGRTSGGDSDTSTGDDPTGSQNNDAPSGPIASKSSVVEGSARAPASAGSTQPRRVEASTSAPEPDQNAAEPGNRSESKQQTQSNKQAQPGKPAGAQAQKEPPAAQQAPAPRASEAAGKPAASPSAGGATAALPPINEPGFSRAHAGPSVRKFARELGVDLTRISGQGFKGRITHDDVKAFVKNFLASGSSSPAASSAATQPKGGGEASGWPQLPVIDFSQFGPTETRPLSRIQRIAGPRLHASWVNIPHVTQFDEADITELEDMRQHLQPQALQQGIKLTPLAFIVRACVKALQEFPVFNASLDASGANLILKKYVHIGFAADTPNGLMVPVVRDADHKDVYEIARQLGELSQRARAGKLPATEMQGGSFTISSLGGIGGTAFTPIINAPEVAILGVSRSAMRPLFRDGGFVPRLMLPVSLSYDHRVIDGALAARFTTFLARTLAEPRALTEAVP